MNDFLQLLLGWRTNRIMNSEINLFAFVMNKMNLGIKDLYYCRNISLWRLQKEKERTVFLLLL